MNVDKLGKAAISLFMAALMILPLLAPIAPVTQAVNPDRNIFVKPDNLAIVPGQNAVIFVDSQTGAFDPNSGLFVKVEDVLTAEWYSYIAALGDNAFPRVKSDNAGKIASQPIFLSSLDTSTLAEGTYEVWVTDTDINFDSYLSDTFQVVELGSTPKLYIDVPGFAYHPDEVVDVWGQTILDFDQLLKVRVGDEVPIALVGFPDTATSATLYWDNLQNRLGTASLVAGGGTATVVIPESSMGVHAIIAVAQASIEGEQYSFVAVNFVYVVPSVEISERYIIIGGDYGEEIRITLHGYPAGYHLDDSYYGGAALINNLTFNLGDPDLKADDRGYYPLDIIRNPEVPSNGKLTIRAQLEREILDPDKGLLDLVLPVKEALPLPVRDMNITYDDGSNQLVYQKFFVFSQSIVASTPKYPGDEGIFIVGKDYTKDVIVNTGDKLKIMIYNFPAAQTLKLYIGAWEVARITTDRNGGATLTLTVPEIPYGTYLIKVVHEKTGLVAYKPTAGLNIWKLKVIPTKPADSIKIDPQPGQLVHYSRSVGMYYIDEGVPIKIRITGLRPFEVVVIREINPVTSSVYPGKVVERATINGVVETVYYTTRYAPNDLTEIIRLEIISKTILEVYGSAKALEYHPTASSSLVFIGGSTDPVPWISGLSFNYVDVEILNLIPDLPHRLYIDNRLVEIRNPDTNARIQVVATNAGPPNSVQVKVKVPVSTYGPHMLIVKETKAGTLRASGVLLISNPTAGSYVGIDIVLDDSSIVFSGPAFGKYIAGWNFNANEEITISFAQNSRKLITDDNGAFLVDIGEVFGPLELPRGKYALTVQREELNFTTIKPLPLQVEPLLYLPYWSLRYVGQPLQIYATGLDSSKYYYIAWSTDPQTRGEIVTYVQSSLLGTISLEIPTPPGLPFEPPLLTNIYYVQIIPIDNPTHVELAGEVIITPRYGDLYLWWIDLSDYVLLTGQQVSINITWFMNFAMEFGLQLPDDIGLLMIKGKGFVMLETVDGEVKRVIPADLVYHNDTDVLELVFKVPNDLADLEDKLFTVAIKLVYVDLNGVTHQTDYISVAGITRISSGGLLVGLGNVGADLLQAIRGLEEKVVAIQTDLGTVVMTLEELNMTLVDIQDGIATLQTSIGEVKADLMYLKELFNNATVKLDGIMAAIESANATIHVKLDALLDLIGGGQVNLTGIEQGIAQIITELGNLKIQVTDLQTLLAAVGDQVLLAVKNVNTTLADLVVKKGDEVVATLKVDIGQLGAQIVEVKDGVAALDTKLGTIYMDLSEGQAQITGLIEQNGQTLLVINDAITASTDQLAALIQNGVTTVTGALDQLSADMQAGFQNVATEVMNAKDEVKADIANVHNAVAEVDTKVQTVQATVGQVKDDTTAIKSDLADVKNTLSTVKTAIDNLPDQVQQTVAQSSDDVKNTLSTKLDETAGGLKTWSIVNLVLVLVAVILLAYMLFVKKP